MLATVSLSALTFAALAQAQGLPYAPLYDPNGPTQPGLPKGCVGSYPNTTYCSSQNWNLGATVDPCKPIGSIPVAGQQVYIKDELNFCINLPNPDSIFLQNNYYNLGKLPTIVQAEGFVQSFCMGSYLPPGAKQLPVGGIRAAHVVKNATIPGQSYYQIHGYLDCNVLNINCTKSAPDVYDDGGQYDDGPFVSCGKEPYSGVDNSTSGNLGFQHYVEQAGDGLFCMRVCEAANSMDLGQPCDVRDDTAGCEKFMKVTFSDGFSYVDLANPNVVSSASVSLPPIKTTTTTTTTTTTSAAAGATGAPGSASVVATSSKSAAGKIASVAGSALFAAFLAF